MKQSFQYKTIIYWTMDESEEGIDNTITVIEMLVDYLTGDLVFVADGNYILQYDGSISGSCITIALEKIDQRERVGKMASVYSDTL